MQQLRVTDSEKIFTIRIRRGDFADDFVHEFLAASTGGLTA